MRIAPALASLATALCVGTPPAAAIPMERAVLQGLDKTTARVSRIVVPIGESVTFGSLSIELKACDKRPPEETPESAAFLKIVEEKTGEPPVARFSGWMFASSPALSAMEHPVYDIWVLDCASGPETTPTDSLPALPAAPDTSQEVPVETTD